MKILVASDSFKGTLSSTQIGRLAQKELQDKFQVDYLPLSDGGEGLTDALKTTYTGETIEVDTIDPLGRPIKASFLISRNQKLGIIESAISCGLSLMNKKEREPLKASSRGLGILVKDAIDNGAEKLLVGLGGSGTNDAGLGMLSELGVRFYKKDGKEIDQPKPVDLQDITHFDSSEFDRLTFSVNFEILSDVSNPLLGKDGATYTYGSQKGADQQALEQLEYGIRSFASVVSQIKETDYSDIPGTGAAGGLGFAFQAFFRADLFPGIEKVLDLIHFDERIPDYELIITGEGKLDSQSARGKVPFGVLKRAKAKKIPVICVCGTDESENQVGFEHIFSVVPSHASLDESVKNPELHLSELFRKEVIPWIDLFLKPPG